MKNIFQQLEKNQLNKQMESKQLFQDPFSKTGKYSKLKILQSKLQQSQKNYNELEYQIQILKNRQQQCIINQRVFRDGIYKLQKEDPF
jgi:tellurite resistance-related uncharacterized protein